MGSLNADACSVEMWTNLTKSCNKLYCWLQHYSSKYFFKRGNYKSSNGRFECRCLTSVEIWTNIIVLVVFEKNNRLTSSRKNNVDWVSSSDIFVFGLSFVFWPSCWILSGPLLMVLQSGWMTTCRRVNIYCRIEDCLQLPCCCSPICNS
jgi:hypothetical protein